MDYVHSYQSAPPGGEGSHEGRTAAALFMKEAGGLLGISLTFCLLDVIVLPVKRYFGRDASALTLTGLRTRPESDRAAVTEC